MYQALSPLLPGVNWISWPSFLLGLVETFAYGWYSAVIFVPAWNFFIDGIGMNTITWIDRLIPASTTVITSSDHFASLPDLLAYGRDLWERTVLFLDTLRERVDNMIAHERAGMPPLLDFKVETLMDARDFEHPANDAQLRITEEGGNCWADCVDMKKPTVIGLRDDHGYAALNWKVRNPHE